MGYKYETHLHTKNSSACGHTQAKDYVDFYLKLGFDGIFVTDHFYLGNTCIDRSLPWEQWVENYCAAYREAKEEGDKKGLKVFFGWETSYDAEDFLIYGLDEEWLKKHPEVITWNQKEQYENIHAAGGVVVQAHPLRERGYQTEDKIHPFHSDAWEVANASNKPYMDRLALHFAKKYNKNMTAGSDIHLIGKTDSGCIFGIETEKPVNSVQDYMKLLLSGTGYRMNVPDMWLENIPQNPGFEVFLYDEENNRTQLDPEIFPGVPRAVNPREAFLEMAEKMKKEKE